MKTAFYSSTFKVGTPKNVGVPTPRQEQEYEIKCQIQILTMYQLLTVEENRLLNLGFIMTEEELKSAQASEAATSNRLYFPGLVQLFGVSVPGVRPPCNQGTLCVQMSPLQ